MCPELHIFTVTIPTYFLCYVIGFVVSISVLSNLLFQKSILQKYIGVYTISLCGLLLGARSFGIISRLLQIYMETGHWNLKESIHSGIVYLGGLFGYLIVIRIMCVIRKLNWNEICDITAVIIPLFHAFGRMGCFFAGCCYGRISESCLAIPYRIVNENTAWEMRIPVQLMEAGFEMILFLYIYRKRNNQHSVLKNHLLSLYIVAYSTWRFLIEFNRDDIVRGVFYGISFSQIICIVALVVEVDFYILNKWRKKNV